MNKLFLNNLPSSPGVYKMLDHNKDIIYVGKAGNLKKRVSSYFMRSNHSIKNQRLIANIRDIDYQITSNEQDALLLENNLIKEYKPKYNILLRDDKSYPYIHLNKNHSTMKPSPPTLRMTPKKKNNVSHSALETFLKKSNFTSSTEGS